MSPDYILLLIFGSPVIIPAIAGATSWIYRVVTRRTNHERWDVRDRLVRKQVKRAPIAPLETLDEGSVAAFEGVVESAMSTLTAPLSGQDCVAYRVVVRDLVIEERIADLVVRNGGRSVCVYAVPDELLRVGRAQEKLTWTDANAEPVETYLTERGIDHTGIGATVVEYVIAAGARVRVVGVYRNEYVAQGEQQDFRGREKQAVLGASAAVPLAIEEAF